MKNFTILFSFILLASLIGCGRNEPEEKEEIETNYTETSNITTNNPDSNNEATEVQTETDSTVIDGTDIDSDSGLAAAIQRQFPNSNTSQNDSIENTTTNQDQILVTIGTPTAINAEAIVNTPLRNL